MERAGKRLESHQNALSNALRSGDKESIAKAKKSLEDAQRAITFHDTKYRAMVEDTALRISKANQTALDYVNGKTPNIYANNFNQINGDAKNVGIKFTTINEDVVRKRIAEGDIKLPKPRVSVPKDVRWNTKKMNSAVLQGILQGESMNDIAKRLLPIVDSNASSAIRNARTLVTQAENSGRLDSYKALEEQGVMLKKVWMATPDDRTRVAHLELDGEEVDIDEPFIDIDGNALMFPADPDADPSTVYNCRCTMVARIEGVNRDTPSMHEEEIERERSRREEEQQREEPLAAMNAPEQIEFIPAETKQDAIDYAQEHFADSVDFGKMSLERINIVNETLTELTAQYPIERLESISVFSRGRAMARANGSHLELNASKLATKGRPYSEVNQERKDIIATMLGRYPNGRVPKDIQRKVNVLSKKTKFTRWSVGDSIENEAERIKATVSHEYGHIVADQYFGQIRGARANPHFDTYTSNELWKTKLKWNSVYQESISNGWKYEVSEYGASNAEEFFAETFAMKVMGEELPENINKVMTGILKNGRL